MIYLEKSPKVETNVEQDSQSFKIAMNSKTFRLLSDTLYSDKIKAVIRELSCNAYDAHVEANNLTKPFEVNLPSIINQEFSIRDYGTGLSEKDLTTLYLTYGESTKDNPNNKKSNELIGCFGIGSKSPFAYVDMFNVTSFYNGSKNTYTIFLDEGIPKCIKIHSAKTKEENGLKISFNVEEKDVNTFKEKAEQVFKYFQMKPNLNMEINISKDVYDIDNEEFSYSSKGNNGRIYALQGNIAYPVDEDFLIDKFKLTFETIVLKFNIGEFSFAPSREALSYDEKTIKIISERVLKVKSIILDKAIKDILSSNSKAEYHTKYLKHYNQLYFCINEAKKRGVYNFQNKEYTHQDIIRLQEFRGIANYKTFYMNTMYSNVNSYNIKRITKKDNFSKFYFEKKYKLIFNDIEKNIDIKKTLNIAIKHQLLKSRENLLVVNIPLEILKTLFSDKDFVSLSDFVCYDKLEFNNIKQKDIIKKVTYLTSNDFSKSVKIDSKKNYYYMKYSKIKNSSYIETYLFEKHYSFRLGELEYLKKAFLKPNDELIFVKDFDLKHLINEPNVLSFDEHIINQKEEFLKINKKYLKSTLIIAKFNNNIHLKNFIYNNIKDLIEIDPLFKNLNQAFIDYKNGKMNVFKIDYSVVYSIIKEKYLENEVEDVYLNLMNKAPLLKHISRANTNEYKDFVEYLKLVFN